MLAMAQSMDPVPILYKLALVDTADPSKLSPIITPTTTVKMLSKTYLNDLV